MEVLKEFLETSNIDGLFYVATAKVSQMKTLGHYVVSEQVGKGNMADSSITELLGSWISDPEVLLQLADVPCLHLNQHSSLG